MKTHSMTLLCMAALALSAVLGSCKGKGAGEDTSGTPALTADSIHWEDSLTIKSCNARVEIAGQYPTAGRRLLLDSVQVWLGSRLSMNVMNIGSPLFTPTEKLLSSGAAIADTCGKTLLRQAESDFKGFATDGITIDYEYDYNFGPEYVTDSIVTYSFTGFAYIGGAHGSTLADAQTFNANSGVRLTYDNVFGPDAAAKLTGKIRAGLWEQYFKDEAGEGMTLRDMLLVDPDTLPLPQTPPEFQKDGIVFIYQQYEIAPYAAGMPQCVFPYSEMKPLMLPEAARLLE